MVRPRRISKLAAARKFVQENPGASVYAAQKAGFNRTYFYKAKKELAERLLARNYSLSEDEAWKFGITPRLLHRIQPTTSHQPLPTPAASMSQAVIKYIQRQYQTEPDKQFAQQLQKLLADLMKNTLSVDETQPSPGGR